MTLRGSRVQQRSHCRCERNCERTRMRSGAWRSDRIAAISWWNSDRWGTASYGWAKKGFLGTDSSPAKNQGRLLKWQLKDLEYYKKSDDELEHILKGKWSNVGKMLSNSMACYREALHLHKELTERQTSMLSYFLTATVTSSFSNHHCDQSAAINLEARSSINKKIMTFWWLR